MREILFRGRTKDGEWHNGWYVKATKPMKTGSKQHEDWIVSRFSANGGWVIPLARYAVDGDTVGQYTGLMDKNGVKIFEGDIVRFEWSFREHKRFENFVVRFSNHAAFLLHPILESNNLWDVTFEKNYKENFYEVIGNIYDNPEILEEESE
jgi:uncharacterized phage protein (TIGR01671 family)